MLLALMFFPYSPRASAAFAVSVPLKGVQS